MKFSYSKSYLSPVHTEFGDATRQCGQGFRAMLKYTNTIRPYLVPHSISCHKVESSQADYHNEHVSVWMSTADVTCIRYNGNQQQNNINYPSLAHTFNSNKFTNNRVINLLQCMEKQIRWSAIILVSQLIQQLWAYVMQPVTWHIYRIEWRIPNVAIIGIPKMPHSLMLTAPLTFSGNLSSCLRPRHAIN